MSSLASLLSSNVPVIWYNTAEPSRSVANVAKNAPDRSSVYFFDPSKQVLTVSHQNSYTGDTEWKTVLVDPSDHNNFVVNSAGGALEYVLGLDDDSILIEFSNVLENIISYVISMNMKHRESWGKKAFPRLVVVGADAKKVPDILRREIAIYEDELPSESQLLEVVGDPEIAKAGLGLSSFEFYVNYSKIMSDRGADSVAEDMHRRKRELLRGDDILDLRRPNLTLADVGGMDNVKALANKIKWAWENPDRVEEMGVSPLRRLLMVGVPGVGKSLTCEAIASMLGTDLAKGGVSQSMSKWVGESEKNVRDMFKALAALAPIVFWVDEFGRDLASGGHDGGTSNRTHGEFLTGIQELPDNVFFAAAANRIEDLPPEMTRADRFDSIMFSGFPTFSERMEIFEIHLRDSPNHKLEDLASATPYFTGAEIKHLIKKISLETAYLSDRLPTTSEIIEAVPAVKSRVWVNHRESIVGMYTHAMSEWEWASSDQEKTAERVLRDATSNNTPVASYTPSSGKMKFSNT